VTPAAIYLRVSKDDGSQTVENQRPEVMQMATGRGYEVAPEHIYEDQASGAKGREGRPALDRLLDAAARGKFRAVFVWALDRLSRDDSYTGGAALLGELDRYNVAVLSHQETWLDTSGPFRVVLVSFAMLIAADFRRRLIARTNAGIDRSRAQLKKSGRYWNERKKKFITHIGRAPSQASDALIDAAAGHRRRAPNDGWRVIARSMRLRGFENVPSATTLRRLCTKRYPDLPTGAEPFGGRRPRR
jgi:DNA invertase Pin-like site-specific DNA recombinase